MRFAYTAVSSEAWAKLRDWASVAGRGRLLLSGSVAHASLKTAVIITLIHKATFDIVTWDIMIANWRWDFMYSGFERGMGNAA